MFCQVCGRSLISVPADHGVQCAIRRSLALGIRSPLVVSGQKIPRSHEDRARSLPPRAPVVRFPSRARVPERASEAA